MGIKPSEMLDLFIENNFDVLPVQKIADLCDIQSKVAQLEAENDALEKTRIDLCVMLKEWVAFIHKERLGELHRETNEMLERNMTRKEAP